MDYNSFSFHLLLPHGRPNLLFKYHFQLNASYADNLSSLFFIFLVKNVVYTECTIAENEKKKKRKKVDIETNVTNERKDYTYLDHGASARVVWIETSEGCL